MPVLRTLDVYRTFSIRRLHTFHMQHSCMRRHTTGIEATSLCYTYIVRTHHVCMPHAAHMLHSHCTNKYQIIIMYPSASTLHACQTHARTLCACFMQSTCPHNYCMHACRTQTTVHTLHPAHTYVYCMHGHYNHICRLPCSCMLTAGRTHSNTFHACTH
jgi:hypothetical protein